MEHSPHLKTTMLSLAALLLAACNQQSPPPESAATSPSHQSVGLVPADASSPGRPQLPHFGLLTPAQATERLKESGLRIPVSGPAPEWTAGLLDTQGHFLSGTLHAGAAIALMSPVKFTPPASAAAADTALLEGFTRDLSRFGDAALIPLLLNSGETVGLARSPLYIGTQAMSEQVEYDYVLFGHPVAGIMTPQAASAESGRPEARVMAVASDARGRYDPFNFHWLVAPALKGGTPTLVAPGLPALVTQNGEVIPAAVPGISPLSAASPETSVDQARSAFAVYTSSTSATPVRTQK